MTLTSLLLSSLFSLSAHAFPLPAPGLHIPGVDGIHVDTTFADPQAAIQPATREDLLGMASLYCSGSLVHLNRKPTDRAVVITNGHCTRESLLAPGETLVNAPYRRPRAPVSIGTNDGMISVTVTRVLYGTMTETDLGLLELKETYAELTAKGAKVFTIADRDPVPGTATKVISGFWEERQNCVIEDTVPTLLEGEWTFKNAFSFDRACLVRGGYSGTPVLDARSDLVIAVVNTVNEKGLSCAINNPCEVRNGEKIVVKNRGYAQRVTDVPACVDAKGEIALSQPGCKLPR